jgi:hypothetical protein
MNEKKLVQTKRTRPKQWLRAFIPQRHRVQGRALAKVRTGFEGAHCFRKVRILENPDDSFEDAHVFPRCAPKTCASSQNGAPLNGDTRVIAATSIMCTFR